MKPNLGLELIGNNGKKQAMDEAVFEMVLELGKVRRRKEYSNEDAKGLANALRIASKQPPHSRNPSSASTLGFIARFFESSRGFKVAVLKLPVKEPPSEIGKSLDPMARERIREIQGQLLDKVRELEERG